MSFMREIIFKQVRKEAAFVFASKNSEFKSYKKEWQAGHYLAEDLSIIIKHADQGLYAVI